jgi:hypothetical protein
MKIKVSPIAFILCMVFWIPGTILLVWKLGWLAALGVVLVSFAASVRTNE